MDREWYFRLLEEIREAVESESETLRDMVRADILETLSREADHADDDAD